MRFYGEWNSVFSYTLMSEMHKGRASVEVGHRRLSHMYKNTEKGKKEDNCGFVKVEVRNHMCVPSEPHLQVNQAED